MFAKTLRIDLKVPKSWNQCSREQLETIATVIVVRTASATLFHPIDMYAVRVDCFFALAGLEIMKGGDMKDDTPVEKRYYLCRVKGTKETFPVYLWQVDSFVNSELSWIGDEKSAGLTNFVYPTLKRGHFFHRHTYDGPGTLMQDFSWQRYRFAQDYMEWYVKASNHLVQMIRRPRQFSKDDVKEQQRMVEQAEGHFLATIYNRKITYTDPDTGRKTRGFNYSSSQADDNWQDFRGFDPIKWQVILLWWSGMMKYLKHKYKRVYKRQNVDTSIPTTPLDLYTRTVATMEKYLGLDEQTVNNQNFHIVLQHMEDIAASNEEMEKIRKK